jgi:hypothetical protein
MRKTKPYDRTAVLVAVSAAGVVLAALITGIASVASAWLQSGGGCPS